MTKEELQALGIEESLAEKLANGELGELIPYARFKEVVDEKNELKAQLSERDNQLKDLGKLTKDNDELKSKIKELQDLNKVKSEEYESNLAKLKLDTAIDLALTNNGVKNNKALKALLDLGTIKLDNDNLVGLSEQLEKLKTTDSYLFKDEVKLSGLNPQNGSSAEPKSLDKMSYAELVEYYDKGE